MDIPLIPIVAAVALIILTAIYNWIKHKGVLPGPSGVPYLGLYPFLTDENVHLKLDEYKKTYGDVFSFTYTGRLFINIGSVKAIRELHVNKSEHFAGRYRDTNLLADMLSNGVTFINGQPWKVLRKYFIQRFKDYGLNTVRDNMTGPVYDSLNETMEDMRASDEKPVNVVELFMKRCSVSIRKIIFGEKGVTDEELFQMVNAYNAALDGNAGVNMLLIGPLARLLFAVKPSFRKNFKNHKHMINVILQCVKKIKATMNEDDPKCIIEDFYQEKEERRRNKDPSWKVFSDESLVDSISQFVGDGIMAVVVFIAGLLNTLLEYPDEQNKLFSELIEVVGPNRQPTAEDRPNMPYTNAFLNEYVRAKSFVHIFPSLECTKETSIRGYRIPVGSITVYNFWSAHHDPETFEDPDSFKPSRYLTSPGKSKAESPVVFGMGKRSCFGEAFVMLQSFLFLTTILKNFKVVSPNSELYKGSDFFALGKLEIKFIART